MFDKGTGIGTAVVVIVIIVIIVVGSGCSSGGSAVVVIIVVGGSGGGSGGVVVSSGGGVASGGFDTNILLDGDIVGSGNSDAAYTEAGFDFEGHFARGAIIGEAANEVFQRLDTPLREEAVDVGIDSKGNS